MGGQLLSAASLAVFSASVARLAGHVGRGSRALRAMAIAGGALAMSLAASATAAAVLTAGPGRDEDRARSPHRFLFAAGGPVHGAGAGAAAGRVGAGGAAHRGVAMAADDRFAGLGWRDALALVVLAVPKAALVVPAGRFPTFVVLGISGVRLARGAGAG